MPRAPSPSLARRDGKTYSFRLSGLILEISERGRFLRLRRLVDMTFGLPGQMVTNMRDVLVGMLGEANPIPLYIERQKNRVLAFNLTLR